MALGEPVFTTFESVLIMAIARVPSIDVLEEIATQEQRLLFRYPDGISLVMLREQSGYRFTGLTNDVRARARELIDRFGSRTRGVAYVYSSEGFTSSMARMAVNGVTMFAPFKARLCSDTREAADWIASLDGQPAAVRDGSAGLLESMELLRGRLRMAEVG